MKKTTILYCFAAMISGCASLGASNLNTGTRLTDRLQDIPTYEDNRVLIKVATTDINFEWMWTNDKSHRLVFNTPDKSYNMKDIVSMAINYHTKKLQINLKDGTTVRTSTDGVSWSECGASSCTSNKSGNKFNYYARLPYVAALGDDMYVRSNLEYRDLFFNFCCNPNVIVTVFSGKQYTDFVEKIDAKLIEASNQLKAKQKQRDEECKKYNSKESFQRAEEWVKKHTEISKQRPLTPYEERLMYDNKRFLINGSPCY